MTFNNDYLKGYLAALRTVQNAVENLDKGAGGNLTKSEEYPEIMMKGLSKESILVRSCIKKDLLDFIIELRNSYKELVDKLNSESEKKNGTKS